MPSKETIRRLEAVTDTALARLSLEELLSELLVRVRSILGADTAAILLLNGGDLVARVAKGLEEEVEAGVRIPLGRGFAGRVAAERRPIFIADVDHADVLNPILRQKGVRSLLGVPILFEGEVIGVLHVGTLKRRQFDRQDAQLLQVVADRIGLGIEYARLYREAQEGSRLKDEFLATVSHELRTPLTPILAWVSQLRRGTLDPARTARALEAIDRGARAQARLVDDLLEVSRMIGGKLHLDVRPMRLAAVIEAAIETMRPAASARDIRVETRLDPRIDLIQGDPGRLQQVMWNLLSNAIKFTPEGGRVDVVLKRVDSHLELSVRDTGKGIRSEFLPHLFERFRQADASVTRTLGGLGLGLAIVRHLVELHGGTIEAESAGEGKGTTFRVRIPLRVATEDTRAQEAREASTGEERAPLGGLRVLVVDDEPDTCDVLEAVLREAGAEVRACRSAAEALAELDTWWPDVLLSDIGMPGEDGYSLIRRVRAEEARHGRAIAAVALTAYARAEDRRKALSAGFQMHVPKPIDGDDLIAVVVRARAAAS
jgi:signal transduction histidine kinase/ActR/RegA family two-component response regulator